MSEEEYKCVMCGCRLTEETACFYQGDDKESYDPGIPICSECLATKTVLKKYLIEKKMPSLVKKFRKDKEKRLYQNVTKEKKE